jgi:hypothetical protein
LPETFFRTLQNLLKSIEKQAKIVHMTGLLSRGPKDSTGGTKMTHHHSLREALNLAESLDEDASNYLTVRELKVQLRALLKDQEQTA